MLRTSLGLVSAFLLAAVTSLSGCSSQPADDGGEIVADAPEMNEADHRVVLGTTRSFTGKFTIATGGGEIEGLFGVTAIDWNAGTAVWNLRIIENTSDREIEDDLDIEMQVEKARCPGCAIFIAKDAVNGGDLAVVEIRSEQLHSITYSGFEGANLELESAKDGEGAAGGNAGHAGTCTLTCGEYVDCIEGVEEADCSADRFDSRPRCPYEVSYAAGGTCTKAR
jgi:hypothetical protein